MRTNFSDDIIPQYKMCVAPMMDWTDRHCRFFLRLLSPSARLYTEMITATALIYGDVEKLLKFDAAEHPVALQLGGNDPVMMATAADLGAKAGYDEININVGCPSDRVQNGRFGACLMANPDVVASCYKEMKAAIDVPVTIKTRIGIDDQNSYEFLRKFVTTLQAVGCNTFIVHARIAILQGFSPKDNRSIPPLNYDRVYKLKREFPNLNIVLNGGMERVEQALSHIPHIDGLMIGRQAYREPYFLAELEQALLINKEWRPPSRYEVVDLMIPYIQRQLSTGTELKNITRHLLGLFAGQPGARAWRRYLSEKAHLPDAGVEVLHEALERLPKAL
jgi:tRNA-dihydrouridine synthase A